MCICICIYVLWSPNLPICSTETQQDNTKNASCNVPWDFFSMGSRDPPGEEVAALQGLSQRVQVHMRGSQNSCHPFGSLV